jgi:hypothetical protein
MLLVMNSRTMRRTELIARMGEEQRAYRTQLESHWNTWDCNIKRNFEGVGWIGGSEGLSVEHSNVPTGSIKCGIYLE